MRPVDLTLTISESLPAFPGSPAPRLIPWGRIVPDGYDLELLFCSTHSGTHMDAPSHFLRGGRTIDRVPASRLLAEAVLIRLGRAPDQPITKKDIARFESKNGEIPDSPTVVFATGWSARPASRSYFERNPGLSADAAGYLASKNASLVGIDSPSIDLGTARGFPAHRILSESDTLIVENLTNLDKIKKHRFRLAVMPLKLKGASGSPVRAVAV